MKTLLSRLNIDPYIASILGMVALASALPAQGAACRGQRRRRPAPIALMFFLQGARLAPQAALAGARHWRLHAVVLASTFLLFPALGLTARAIAPGLLTPPLWARAADAVPAAVHRAVLDRLHLDRPRQRGGGAVRGDRVQPVRHPADAAAGGPAAAARTAASRRAAWATSWCSFCCRSPPASLRGRWIGAWVGRHKALTSLVDRGSILLVVYVAFSEGVTHGIWHQLDAAPIWPRCCCWMRPAGARPAGDQRDQPAARLRPGRSDHHRVLRLEEEPGERPADGERAVRRPVSRADRAAADAVPSDPAHGMRGAGTAVCGGADARTAVDATCRQWSVSGERILGRDAERREVAQSPWSKSSGHAPWPSPQWRCRQTQVLDRGRRDLFMVRRFGSSDYLLRRRVSFKVRERGTVVRTGRWIRPETALSHQVKTD